MNNNGDFRISWKTCMRICVCVLILFLIIRYWGSVETVVGLLIGGTIAIVSGFVIAYVVNIPMRFFERVIPGETGDGTRNRVLSMVLAIACIVAVLLFVVALVIPQLITAIIVLTTDAPTIIDEITKNEIVCSIVPASIISQIQNIDWPGLIDEVLKWLQTGVVSSLPQITTLIGQIGAWFMGIVFAFWYLAEKNALANGAHTLIRTYISVGADERFSSITKLIDQCFHGYIVGQSLEALLFGSLVAIGSTLFGLPDSLAYGALVGAMSLIPMIGALIGAILCALMIFTTSWQQAIIFIVLFFIVQQIEANFLYPRVVGKHVGLTGMWPLIGITLGTALFGFVGAFLGVPTISAVYHAVEGDLARRAQSTEEEASPFDKLRKQLSDD